LLLAASLSFYLHRLRSKQHMYTEDADSLITKLSIYAVSTGMMTGAVGLATLLCYYLMPLNFIFIAVFFLLGKLYGVSLLAALNTRQHVETNSTYRSNGHSQQIDETDLDSLTSLPLRNLKRPAPGSYSRHRVASSKASSIRTSRPSIRRIDQNLSSTQFESDLSLEPGPSGSNLQLPIIRIPDMLTYPQNAQSWVDDAEANLSRFSHLTE